MRVAFVLQPGDRFSPDGARNSIAIWTAAVASQLASAEWLGVYGRRLSMPASLPIGVTAYRPIRAKVDERVSAWLPGVARSDRPAFARMSRALAYALQVGWRARHDAPEIIHVHNQPQVLPVLRRLCPRAALVLHMHCHWLSQLDPRLMSKYVRHADRVLCCSEQVAAAAREALPEFAARIHALHNGYDPALFTPRASAAGAGDANGPIKLLFVGRVSPEKGVHVLLDAVAELVRAGLSIKLKIVGPQTPAPRVMVVDVSRDPVVQELAAHYQHDYFAALAQFVRDHDLSDAVEFIAHAPHADLPALYNEADVFVFPAVWEEPFGMPVLEAMACGLPVVATNGGGIPEMITNEQTGLLASRNNADALVTAIRRLVGDLELRRSLGAAARERAIAHFTWRAITDALTGHWQAALRGRK